jgi:hypothetical protein
MFVSMHGSNAAEAIAIIAVDGRLTSSQADVLGGSVEQAGMVVVVVAGGRRYG